MLFDQDGTPNTYAALIGFAVLGVGSVLLVDSFGLFIDPLNGMLGGGALLCLSFAASAAFVPFDLRVRLGWWLGALGFGLGIFTAALAGAEYADEDGFMRMVMAGLSALIGGLILGVPWFLLSLVASEGRQSWTATILSLVLASGLGGYAVSLRFSSFLADREAAAVSALRARSEDAQRIKSAELRLQQSLAADAGCAAQRLLNLPTKVTKHHKITRVLLDHAVLLEEVRNPYSSTFGPSYTSRKLASSVPTGLSKVLFPRGETVSCLSNRQRNEVESALKRVKDARSTSDYERSVETLKQALLRLPEAPPTTAPELGVVAKISANCSDSQCTAMIRITYEDLAGESTTFSVVELGRGVTRTAALESAARAAERKLLVALGEPLPPEPVETPAKPLRRAPLRRR